MSRDLSVMMNRLPRRVSYVLKVAAVSALLLSASDALASVCSANSGAQRVALLELYTSEGCDSCPPADKWVSGLPAKQLETSRLIPLSFHVDYWNYIGWTDPYSQARFSDRQREHSRRRGAGFVVTPQLLLNGQDYRRALVFDDISDKVKAINQTKPQADIRLKLARNGDRLDSELAISVGGGAEQRRAEVYLALYENNLVTSVKAGENKGLTLRHDFVVRELVGPLALDAKSALNHSQSFQIDPRWKAHDIHLAVFVQHPQSGDVLQALSASCR
jgi:hypothetical protein